MGYQKGKIILFLATVTFLSCCSPAASSVLPRVTRTDDAIIVDFADSPIQSKNYNGETIIQLPGFNPYAIMQQKPQKVFYEGWPFFFGYPTPTSPSTRQFEEVQLRQQVGVAPAPTTTKAPTPAPTPAPAPATCGRGPAKFPGTRSLISGRVTTGADVTKAKNNAWPFMVTLKNSAGTLFCSGALISDTKIITAAQCFEKMSAFEMQGVTVLIGMTSLTDVQMTRRTTKIVLNSKFNAFTYANDVAIVTMDSPVIISNTVQPVCLAAANTDPDQYAGQDAIVLGWGTADITKPSATLMQGKVGIVANSECRVEPDFGKYVSDSTICVSSTTAFSCAGDVGGPVVILSAPGTWTLVGINSYTKADCSATGLKTAISAFRAWIDLYKN